MVLTQETKKRVMDYIANDQQRRESIAIAREYYYINNPILRRGVIQDVKDLLRKADNRIAHNFHQLITDEEVDYLLSYAPIIDVGNANANKQVVEILGDSFLKTSRLLSIDACNSGRAWLHYWLDVPSGNLLYAAVPSDQVIPVWKDSLIEELEMLIRYYPITRQVGAIKKSFVRVEVWDTNTCEYFILPGEVASMQMGLGIDDGTLKHNFGRIPFISFANNSRAQGSLEKYKSLIDAYDIVLSGYVNDIMDIQQVIYILENYAGTDLGEFTEELKRYKTVAVGSDGIEGAKGDLRTVTIDIPVEARNSLLEILKKQIYTAGQALSRDVESVGNASGETLKFFYRDLDLKVGDKEVEFTAGYKELVRAIAKTKNLALSGPISVVFTRNKISNDQETAQICKDSVGVIPLELIWANHPFVTDVEKCKELYEKETQEETSDYGDNFKAGNYSSKKVTEDAE